jgi:hypothetical protein
MQYELAMVVASVLLCGGGGCDSSVDEEAGAATTDATSVGDSVAASDSASESDATTGATSAETSTPDDVGAALDTASPADTTGPMADVSLPDASPLADTIMTPDTNAAPDVAAPDTESAPDVPLVPDVAPAEDTATPADVVDPLALPAGSGCPSGNTWMLFDLGSKWMHPGLACIECHAKKGPDFAVAGTIFLGDHIADDCNPAGLFQPSAAQDVTVEVTGAGGEVITAKSNESGNFYIDGTLTQKLTLPYTAVIRQGDKVREMFGPQTNGDCNVCHTVQGTSGAPGRIVAP